MANVLPQSAQKKLWRHLRSRALIMLALALILLALLGALALIPSYLALSFAAPPAPTSAKGSASAPEAASQVVLAQALVKTLSPILSATTSPSALITTVLAQKPKGISVDRITYSADDGTIALSGTGSRENINTFRDLLAKSGAYKSVSVPVSALVGTEGGHFAMTITLLQ